LLLSDLLEARAIAAGKKNRAERIRENRVPYYAALQAADQAWDQGHFDVSALADYLAGLLKAQLAEAA